MTAEKSIKILKAVKELKDDAIYTLTDLTEAYKMAIEALSKQSGGEQANESVIVNFVAFQRKWLKAHKIMELNSADEVMTEIFLKETGKAFINSLSQSVENDEDGTTDDHIADSDKMVDQFRDSAKKTDDVPDTNVGKTDFKPGDKFILELGQERRMFDEFEIAGTDLYVETRLLEKLTRYEPEEKTEKIPYKKPEIIHCTECKKCWYSGTATINGQSCRIFRCSVWERPVSPFGYCYMAKRRNDG